MGTCKHGCCQNLEFKFAAKCGLVELGDDGVLRLHEVTESKKRSAEVDYKKNNQIRKGKSIPKRASALILVQRSQPLVVFIEIAVCD